MQLQNKKIKNYHLFTVCQKFSSIVAKFEKRMRPSSTVLDLAFAACDFTQKLYNHFDS